MSEPAPDMAVLFWFYKDPPVVADRLEGIRRLNPGVRVFGLYGGEHASVGQFGDAVELLDDLWLHPEVPAEWAWRNGDLMLGRWYSERGRRLDWQQVFVHQWDLLTAVPARDFATSGQREILLPGVRPLDEVAAHWVWVQPWSDYYGEFQSFRAHPLVAGRRMLASVFILATLTRDFLADYAEAAPAVPGFIEYRLPTLADVFRYRFAPSEVRPDWGDRGDPLLNGSGRGISPEQVRQRFLHGGQVKVCHPVNDLVPWDEILPRAEDGAAGRPSPVRCAPGGETDSPVAILQVPPARPGLAAGGSQVVTMALARGLVEEQHSVILFSGTTDASGADFKSDGVWYRSAFQLTQDVLEQGEPRMQFFADDLKLLERCRVAFMFDRVFPLPEHVEPILILDTVAYGFARAAVASPNWSRMIVPSEYMLGEVARALEECGQSERLRRVHVVANPLDPAALGLAGGPPPRGAARQSVRLLFPHRADRGKGIDESVRLLSHLCRYRDTTLTMVVDPSPTAEVGLYASVIESAAALGLDGRIEFIPWRPLGEMGELYASADLTLCVGPVPEGFGLVCLESILCGTPVVARNSGAQTRLLPPGHGCFIAPEDEARLAEVVHGLLDDPSLSEQVARGRAYIESNYSTASFLRGFCAVASLG
ncbi:MAG TPA: glycosyltransferase family 4 protein [Pyrinomonadaceae bacterium]|jgi:glycosyltransferase involved in cell wall biosynthesis|nr:glycosyltransferase family 4 protein [Pyrinomonadaceae bacterium]